MNDNPWDSGDTLWEWKERAERAEAERDALKALLADAREAMRGKREFDGLRDDIDAALRDSTTGE